MRYQEINKENILEAIKNTKSMLAACAYLGVSFSTFKRRAQKYGVYKPNQSGIGISKITRIAVPLSEILLGHKPEYSCSRLRERLIKEKYFEPKCYKCGITKWNDKAAPLELEHIDGNKYNHKLENLTILCPNCHAQTPTYRALNKKKYSI